MDNVGVSDLILNAYPATTAAVAVRAEGIVRTYYALGSERLTSSPPKRTGITTALRDDFAQSLRRVPVADGITASFTSQAIWADLAILAEGSSVSCPF